jgi:hypothetical protein
MRLLMYIIEYDFIVSSRDFALVVHKYAIVFIESIRCLKTLFLVKFRPA